MNRVFSSQLPLGALKCSLGEFWKFCHLKAKDLGHPYLEKGVGGFTAALTHSFLYVSTWEGEETDRHIYTHRRGEGGKRKRGREMGRERDGRRERETGVGDLAQW